MPKKFFNYLVLILILSISGFILYEKIFYPSYVSVVSICNSTTIEEVNNSVENRGYTIGGYYNESDDKIILIRYDVETFKHEYIHRVQKLNNRSYKCDNLLGFYMNELEAYFCMRLPDKIYSRIYMD